MGSSFTMIVSFGVAYYAVAICVFVTADTPSFFAPGILFGVQVSYLAVVAGRIGKGVRELQMAAGIAPCCNVGIAVVLTFLGLVSIPYLQHCLNTVVALECPMDRIDAV